MASLDRRALLLGMLGAAGAGVSGCSLLPGGDGVPITPTATGPSPSATAGQAADTLPRWPLTGRRLYHPERARRAAVAVKVPDNQNEHPQIGIDKADIVFVELDGYRDPAGYSGTRLVPVFHSHTPEGVGPVRSIRPVDVALLSPIGAIVGNTGATGWVLNYVKSNRRYVEGELSYLATKGSGSYSIDPDRVRTYQGVTYYDRAVVCHPGVLRRQTRRFHAGPRQAYFPWAASAADVSTAGGEPARVVRVPWKQGHTYDMGYRYDPDTGTYPRRMPWGPHVLADGTRVAPDNVLVIRAAQRYAKIFHGPGHEEPIHDVVESTGSFFYFHGGRYVTGTWSKGALDQLFRLTLDDGSPLKMAPGQTFVELARAKAKVRIRP